MTPLTTKPRVTILQDRKGEVMAVSTNIAPVNGNDDPLTVTVCHSMADFTKNSAGDPFNTTFTDAPVQVLAHRR